MSDLASLWLSDPAWLNMDATARGFHAQLVLIAAQSEGKITNNESDWRRWLGIPEPGASEPFTTIPAGVVQWVNQGTPGRLAQLGGTGALTEYYWVSRWLPMLQNAWKPAEEGKVSCNAARVMAGLEPEAPARQSATKKARKVTRKRARKAPAKPPILDVPLELLMDTTGPRGEGWTYLTPLDDRLMDFDQVKARWHVPVSRATRLNLWSVGLAALSTEPGDEKSNRAFLSSMIKRYGERRVAAAIGEITGRSVPPADPRAFLRAILRRNTEGTAAAQRARSERASVPL